MVDHLHQVVHMRELQQVLLIQITQKLPDMLEVIPTLEEVMSLVAVAVVLVVLVEMDLQDQLHHPVLLLVMVVLVFRFLLPDHLQIHNR